MLSLGKLKTMALVVICLAYAGGVNAAVPLGCYNLNSGKFSASINLPGILTLSASVPALQILNITNSFADDHGFSMSISMLSLLKDLPTDFAGQWSAGTKANTFAVNLTDLTNLASQLDSFGIHAKVTQTFTGKVVDVEATKISGSFNIALNAKLGTKAASAKLSGTFIGKIKSSTPCVANNQTAAAFALQSQEQGGVQSTSDFASIIANALIEANKSQQK